MRCDVRFRDEATFVLSWATDAKNSIVQILRDPIIKLVPNPTASDLGQAVRRALDLSAAPEALQSFHGISQGFREKLRAVGIKGWSRFESSSRHLFVEDDGSRVKIHPCSFRDTDPHLAAVTCGRDPEEMGCVLLELRPSCPISDPLSEPRPGSSYQRHRSKSASNGGMPQTFGYKCRWLVVDSTDATAVASELGLKNRRPATWDIDPYDVGGVFVSSSVLGWTYVLGLNVEPHYPQFIPLLEGLSRRFGEVQYFTTHRVVELQAWTRAIDGRITRGYCWIGERGEVVMDVGALTPEEEELGFSRFINSRTRDGDWESVGSPDEEDVMRIAGKWSINPQELDAYDSEGPGVLGDRARS